MKYEFPKAKEAKGNVQARWVEQKYDGMRICFVRQANEISVRTRTEGVNLWHYIKEVPHLRKLASNIPNNCIVDCELWADYAQSTDIKSLLIARDPSLRVTAFALPFWNGAHLLEVNMPFVHDKLLEMGFEIPRIEERFDSLRTIDFEKLVTLAQRIGIEGYVAKQDHLTGWFKIKPVKTADLFVVGVNVSTSATYFGLLESLKCNAFVDGEWKTVANVGGLTESVRKMKPEEVIGRVCEVRYDSVAAKGRLRFPRFIMWRNDKTKGECDL